MNTKPFHVLMVTNDLTNAEHIRELLGDTQEVICDLHITRPAKLHQLTADRIDAVLADLGSVGSGWQDMLRAVHAAAPTVPIIALTAAGDRTSTYEAFRAGVQDSLPLHELDRRTLARSIQYAIMRKQIELERDQADEIRQLLASIVENSTEAIFSKTLAGTVLSWNRGAEQLYGYTAEEMIGRSISIISPPGYQNELMQMLEKIGQGENIPRFQTQRQRKDGRLIDISIAISAIRGADGQVTGASAIAHDISEHKQAEDKLAQAYLEIERERRRLKTVLSTLPVGVAIGDVDGRFLEFNEELYRIWGGNAPLSQEVSEYGEFKAWWADTGERLKSEDWAMARALKGETSVGEVIDIQSFDGQRRTILNSAKPIRDANGQIIGTVAALMDITHRREMEKALRRSEQHLRNVLSSLFAFVGLLTPDGVLIEANRAALEAANLDPNDVLGKRFEETYWWAYSPDVQQQLRDSINCGLAGKPSRYDVLIRLGEDHYTPIDFMIAPMVDDEGHVTHLIPSAIDISQRKQAEAERERLLTEIEQERDRLRALLESMTDEVWFCDLQGNIYPANTAAYQGVGISIDRVELPSNNWSELLQIYDKPRGWRRSDENSPMQRSLKGETLKDLEETIRRMDSGELRHRQFSSAPIKTRSGEIIGSVAVARDITERKQIELREREQRILAEALRDTANTLNSTLKLTEVLDRILQNIEKVVPHDAAEIMMLDGSTAHIARSRGYIPPGDENLLHTLSFDLQTTLTIQQMYESGQPIIIPDVHQYPGWIIIPQAAWVRSFIGAPIRVQDTILGFLNLTSAQPGFFTPIHAERLQAFAVQAAIAIQNARLYEQAQEWAVIEERQRLARDLHDAVSQTLFSISIMAESLSRQLQRHPERVAGQLEQITLLTRGALAEMRTLLLELRPTSLVEVELNELIRQLSEAIRSRKRIKIVLRENTSYDPPPEVKLNLYRIAQEALNNIVKHSQATVVNVHLNSSANRVELTIHDNGRGFDPGDILSTSLGLGIMRERAQEVGAQLTIQTISGQGTQVRVVWINQHRPILT